MLQIGIRAQGFNTEPGWAMLVEIEAMLRIGIIQVPRFQH
jgi:hypothetical protein